MNIQCRACLSVLRLSFCCFFTWFHSIFLSVSVLFVFFFFVQFAAVLINGKMSKVVVKKRCTCVWVMRREAMKPVCTEETWHMQQDSIVSLLLNILPEAAVVILLVYSQNNTSFVLSAPHSPCLHDHKSTITDSNHMIICSKVFTSSSEMW